MPVSNYKVLFAENPAQLTEMMNENDYAPIGSPANVFRGIIQAVGDGVVPEFGDVTVYEMVQGSTLQELADKVNAKIAENYQPISGGVIVSGNVYLQGVGLVAYVVPGGT